MIVTRRESLTSQRLLTICATEALTMIRIIFVADATLRDHLNTLGAFSRVGLLIARHTKYLVFFWYEALGTDGRRACEAQEAVLMELLSFVFHLFHAGLEYLRAFIASYNSTVLKFHSL